LGISDLFSLLLKRGYCGGSLTAVQGDPAVCGSHPLVTPWYYCRLGDCMCLFIVGLLLYFVFFAVLGFLYFCSVLSLSTLILLVGSFDL